MAERVRREPTTYEMNHMDTSDIVAMRTRPGMYVGDTRDGSGLHHLLWEVVGNALDEFLAGRATRIDVTLNEDGSVTVEDDGGGIPIHEVDGVPFAQRALTTFHTTGTLDGHVPHAHVGWPGVGISVVNALSTWLVLDVFRSGHHFCQRYVAQTPEALLCLAPTERSGTRFTFAPDPEIFAEPELSYDVVAKRLREISFLNAGLRIELRDHRPRDRVFHYPTGLRGFLDAEGSARPRGVETTEVLTCKGVKSDVRVDVALRFRQPSVASRGVLSFANTERTTLHGTHVDGLLEGIADALVPELSAQIRHSGVARYAMQDCLDALVHVCLENAQFSNPTTDELGSPEVTMAVRAIVGEQLVPQLATRPRLRDQIVAHIRKRL